MKTITVATTKGNVKEKVYEINELPLYEIMMRAQVTKKRAVHYLEIPCAFDIETTNIDAPEALGNYHYIDARLFKHLSELKLLISPQIKKDITDYNQLRRQYPRMLSGTKGVPVDVVYEELSGLYPYHFPRDIIAPSDELLKILEVLEANRPKEFRPFSYMYHWQFCIAGFVCFGRTWEEFRTLLNRLQSEMNLSEQNRLVCYIHNAGFEFVFMKHYINVVESFFREENKPLKFTIAEGIEFRDSLALSNMNLLKFCENSGAIHVKLSGEDFNYSVIRTPKTDLTEDEQAYCYNDVAGLVECIAVRMREHHLNEIPLTSTGYVRRRARSDMRANKDNRRLFKETALDPVLYTMCKQAFRGGDVHGNPAYADQTLFKVGSVDISSAYPTELVISNHFPIGKFHKISARRFKYARRYDRCYLLKLRIDIPRYIGKCGNPYISYSKITALHDHSANAAMSVDNGRLRSYDGIIEMTVTDIDYEIIRNEYEGIFFISDVYEAPAGRLPEEFRNTVLEFYRQKTALKGVEEKYYYYCRSKEMLNACYGMCATKIDQSEIEYDSFTHEFKEIQKPLAEVLTAYYKNRNNFLPYQWGVFCTALVRAKLRRAMNACGKYTVYCDTDSVKFLYRDEIMNYFNEENKKLQQAAEAAGAYATDAKGKIHYLGLWEYEGTFDTFRHIGSKRYMYTQDGKTYVTIAGVNKARAAEFFTKAGIEKFTNGTVIQNSGHLVAYYNDDAPHDITVDGCTFNTASNVALINDTYTLGIDKNYGKLIKELKNGIVRQEYI